MLTELTSRAPYFLVVALACTGVFTMLAQRDQLKAMVGLALLQSSIILFFILLAVRRGGSVPITAETGAPLALHNPLPHALVLTAIVVGVATLGVAMAILRCYRFETGSLRDGRPERPADQAKGEQA
jgi:multicomponent Na+:H+ antiporter subunit C